MTSPTTTGPDLLSLAIAGKGTLFSMQTALAAVTGECNTTGTTVTATTGTFTTGSLWVGLLITINSISYEIASVTSATVLVLASTAGTQTAQTFTVENPTLSPVAELKSYDFSGSKNDLEDVTNFDSLGRFKQYVATLADSGDVSISGNYVSTDAGQRAFRSAFNSGAQLSFQMILPLQAGQITTGETWNFQGFVSELDNQVSYDKIISFTAKLKVTGPVNVVFGS